MLYYADFTKYLHRSPDGAYCEFGDSDTLSVYLRKATRGVIADTWDVYPGMLVDFDEQEQPVSLHISSASCKLPMHLRDTAETIEGKEPMTLGQVFDQEGRVLTMWFHHSAQFTHQPTQHDKISIVKDENGAWIGLRIEDAFAG